MSRSSSALEPIIEAAEHSDGEAEEAGRQLGRTLTRGPSLERQSGRRVQDPEAILGHGENQEQLQVGSGSQRLEPAIEHQQHEAGESNQRWQESAHAEEPDEVDLEALMAQNKARLSGSAALKRLRMEALERQGLRSLQPIGEGKEIGEMPTTTNVPPLLLKDRKALRFSYFANGAAQHGPLFNNQPFDYWTFRNGRG